MDIGLKIKALRKERKLSQIELADGICSQAIISNLEKNGTLPSRKILEKITNKLGISVNSLYEYEIPIDIKKINSLISANDFRELENYYHELEKAEIMPLHIPYFHWLRIIILFKNRLEKEKAINELEKKINRDNINGYEDEHNIRLIVTLADFHLAQGNFEKAYETYALIQNYIQQIEDICLKSRYHYRYAQVLTKLEKYYESLSEIAKLMRIILEHRSIYLLGEALLIKAYAFYQLEQYAESKLSVERAKVIFDIQNNEEMVTCVIRQLELLKGKI